MLAILGLFVMCLVVSIFGPKNNASSGQTPSGQTPSGPPTITSIGPNLPIGSRQITDTNISITGTNLEDVTQVFFNEVLMQHQQGFAIIITPPEGTTIGEQSIRVVTPGGSVTSNLFSYVNGVPLILNMDPSAGPLSGGTSVTVTGSYFTNILLVSIDGINVYESLEVVDSNSFTVTTPENTAKFVTIRVVNPGGAGILENAFEYVEST